MLGALHLPGRLPLLTELALVGLLAWIVSGWLLPESAVAPSGPDSGHSATTTAALPELSRLLSVPLFGKPETRPQPANRQKQPPTPVAVSPLNLKLLGTVVADEHAAAIIATAAGREQRVFFVGDSIQLGVILKQVAADAIIVERAGKLERISLEHSARLSAAPQPTLNRPAIRPRNAPPAAIRKQMQRAHLRQQLQNFPALLSQARIVPHLAGGKPDGFVISEIAPGSLYQQAGLQNGDILLAVNGQPITSAKQAMHMYQTLQQTSAIDLQLMRAGRLKQIHYDIR